MASPQSDKAVEAAPRLDSSNGGPGSTHDIEKNLAATTEEQHAKESDDESSSGKVQAGVRAVEATAKIWSKWHLIAAYGLIWLIYCIVAMQAMVLSSLTPYVTSSFQLHSLTGATSIMSSIIGGLTQIPLAKILDTWGRPQGLALMLFCWVIGFIMMAACQNVQTYAAAQVFSSVGSTGVSYTLTVFVSDTSSLKSRALMLAFATSPYVAFTWVGGPISQSVLNGPGFRWGFGIFAIVVPAVVLPLIILLLWNERKAEKAGLLTREKTPFTLESIKAYLIDIDALGCLILAAGMALFLLPFSLYSYQGEGWKSPMVISMIVIGGLILLFFVYYERSLTPVTFIPFHLLTDRTVLLTGIMLVFIYFSGSVWGGYFTSMLQVVWELDVEQAGYVGSVQRVAQCLWGVAVGFFIRYTGRFKWVQLSMGIPLMILALGLMVKFRTDQSNIGLIVMSEIFVGASSGAIVLSAEMAMMTPSDHQHIAVIIAILNLFCSIGSAMGGTVSAAIWTGVFPAKLAKYLPEGTDIVSIYGDLKTQLSYASGSPERNGIKHAYADAQRLLLAASLGLLCGALICAIFWRDLKVKDKRQTKGLVA